MYAYIYAFVVVMIFNAELRLIFDAVLEFKLEWCGSVSGDFYVDPGILGLFSF